MAAKNEKKRITHPAWLGGEAQGEADWEANGDTSHADAIIAEYLARRGTVRAACQG